MKEIKKALDNILDSLKSSVVEPIIASDELSLETKTKLIKTSDTVITLLNLLKLRLEE